jgi:hypothetical protein
MIVPPSGVRVWLATGATDMRRVAGAESGRPCQSPYGHSPSASRKFCWVAVRDVRRVGGAVDAQSGGNRVHEFSPLVTMMNNGNEANPALSPATILRLVTAAPPPYPCGTACNQPHGRAVG